MASVQPIDEVLATLEAAVEHRQFNHAEFFKPYPKQRAFFTFGAVKRERMLFGANQSGKTECGAFETACHLTGHYPKWWKGRRFDHPVRAWAAGDTSLNVRDTQQKKLCGEPGVDESFGTGMIPRACFVDKPTLSRGVSDAFDTIQVQHYNPEGTPDGISVLKFKSYEQGRLKFQGETLDFVWTDEECPMNIYTEILARITATRGFVFGTFTPLKGRTALVDRFQNEEDEQRAYLTMSLYECGHMTPEDIAEVVKGYPIHEREARINGVPMQGAGRVFPYDELLISEPSMPADRIPAYWKKLWAVDFGIGHPFAAVLLIQDPETGIIHIHHTIRVQAKPGEAGGLPINHASAMRAVGAMVPVAWPHDGNARDKGSGVTLAASYRKEGLRMLGSHATFREGGYSTEAGILEMDNLMQNGRLKVGQHLGDWFEEYRNYHREVDLTGLSKIVKMNDDLMSATRIGIMQIRSAQPVPLGHKLVSRRPDEGIASGLDFDVFGGR